MSKYFNKFPLTPYTLDGKQTVQLITNIATRVVISDEISQNLSLSYKYSIKDGETPEILADQIYNDPQLHWVILHCNEIHNPLFEWPLSVPNLVEYVESKYPSRDSIHHYEDENEVIITGNVYVNSSNGFASVSASDVLLNNTAAGIGVVVSKISNSNVIVNVSTGGFKTGDQVKLFSNANIIANISSTTTINCTAVTSFVHEDRLNEAKREIRILKPQYLDAVIREFENKINL